MALKVKRPERTVRVCLDGALVAEYEAVEAELEDVRNRKLVDARLNDPVAALERRLGELWEKQQAETVVFRLRALSRHAWDDLKSDHKPRADHKLDEHYGFNTGTIFDAALASDGVIVEVTKNGKKVPFKAEDWGGFSEDLTAGQFADFQVAGNELNGGQSEVPFSYAGYKRIHDSGENSN